MSKKNYFLLSLIIFNFCFGYCVDPCDPLSIEDRYSAYSSLENVLPPDYQGWFGKANMEMLGNLIREQNAKVVVELGSWLGKSTIWIARMLPKDGRVYAVDTWLGSQEQVHQEDPRLPTLYEQFLSNIIHQGLTDKIVPIRITSVEAGQRWPSDIIPDIVYLDASHEEFDVYQDLTTWYPVIGDTGVLCGDDFNWPGVKKSVIRFAKEQGLSVKDNGRCWVLISPEKLNCEESK